MATSNADGLHLYVAWLGLAVFGVLMAHWLSILANVLGVAPEMSIETLGIGLGLAPIAVLILVLATRVR